MCGNQSSSEATRLMYPIVSVLIDILEYHDGSNTNHVHVLITRGVWGIYLKEKFELGYHSIPQGCHFILYGFHSTNHWPVCVIMYIHIQ